MNKKPILDEKDYEKIKNDVEIKYKKIFSLKQKQGKKDEKSKLM